MEQAPEITDRMIQRIVDSICNIPPSEGYGIYTQRIHFLKAEKNIEFMQLMDPDAENEAEAEALLINELKKLRKKMSRQDFFDMLCDPERSSDQIAGEMEEWEHLDDED